MKLVDMKRTKAEIKERDTIRCEPLGGEQYPYGTRITLENEAIDKIGLDSLPKVGSKVTVQAMGVITSVSSNESSTGRKDRRIEIQLQKLGVEPGAASMKDAVDDAVEEADDE